MWYNIGSKSEEVYAEGSPIGMQYRASSYAENVFDYYFFEKNLQGDIVAYTENQFDIW